MARKAKSGRNYVVHAHGCTTCHDRYEDACNLPNNNSECMNCRAHSAVRSALSILARLPHVCCFSDSRLARKDEIERYSLSRACMWFICNTCKRTFPYTNPKHLPAEQQISACCFYSIRPVDDIIRRRLQLASNVITVCVLCGTPEEVRDA